jgi:putative SOS response-associated peptidase YedK
MCGRYSLTNPERISLAFPTFRFAGFSEYRLPRFNVAPTQSVLGVRNDGRKVIESLRWGLLSFGSTGTGLINARAETLAQKPSFRDAYERQRCAIFADGFYEWRDRRPTRFSLRSGEPFAFAGLWEPGGGELATCAIITCEPNELVATVHDRMPVILAGCNLDVWLSGEELPNAVVRSILRPYDARKMESRAASMRLNKAAYDAPDVLEDDTPVQTALDLH